MSKLFSPFSLRSITLRNRIVVSPMQQYSVDDGMASDWHLVHLGSRAVGGAGLVIAGATAVTALGRWSLGDLGLWKDAQVAPFVKIARFIREQGAVAGIQIGHAGSKGSRYLMKDGFGHMPETDGGWEVVSSSAVPAMDGFPVPRALSIAEIQELVQAYGQAARRAREAGFQWLELHGAHGYLIHQFLSPRINRRTDAYGGSWENRLRFLREVTEAVRQHWPEDLPLGLRISAVDFIEKGPAWRLDDSVALAKEIGKWGIDVLTPSGGGFARVDKALVGPGYQVPFASAIRQQSGFPTMAVGMITDPVQADTIVRSGQADLVALAREMLRDPYFALRAAQVLGDDGEVPHQYDRAWS